jgi:hypothetical protein
MVRFTDSIADEQPTATRKVQLSGGQAMTRDDIILLAQKVDADTSDFIDYYYNQEMIVFSKVQLERFATLVAAAERKACAKIADDEANDAMTAGEHNPKSNAAWNISLTAKRVADAIRARGESK